MRCDGALGHVGEGVTCEVWWGLRTCRGGEGGFVRCGGALGHVGQGVHGL